MLTFFITVKEKSILFLSCRGVSSMPHGSASTPPSSALRVGLGRPPRPGPPCQPSSPGRYHPHHPTTTTSTNNTTSWPPAHCLTCPHTHPSGTNWHYNGPRITVYSGLLRLSPTGLRCILPSEPLDIVFNREQHSRKLEFELKIQI